VSPEFSPEFTAALADLSKKKQTQLGLYMNATEAYGYVTKHSSDSLFVDIRTRSEVAFLGMPTIADANIPYMLVNGWSDWDDKKKNYKLEANSDFVTQIEQQVSKKGLNKHSTIILMCRSGGRSAKAANLLSEAGYKKVYSVIDGYEGDKAKKGEHKGQRVVNGWKNNDLPWSYKLDKDKMYWNM
jgi:rhodanese-related sulfurtransferase